MFFYPPPTHHTTIMADEYREFVESLWEDSVSSYAIISGDATEAKLCAELHRDRDGLICHYFSGSFMDQMTRDAKHTFLVAPGVWAATLIDEFRGDVVLKGPLFPRVDAVEEDFVSGSLGVVLEMSPSDALRKLRNLEKPGLRYRLVRFFSVR